MVELSFLGTAAGSPSPSRNVSSLCVRFDGDVWMVDCGEGTFRQIISKQSIIKPSRISKIFITHLHGDHLYGLPGLVSSMDTAKGATGPLDIYGPKGVREYLETCFRLSRTELARPYRVHELLFAGERPDPPAKMEAEGAGSILQSESGVWEVSKGETVDIAAAPITHRIPCLGYVFKEATGYAALDMDSIQPLLDANKEALKAQGIKSPLSLLSQLKGSDARALTLPDGSTIEPAERNVKGRKLVVLGDTSNPYGPLEQIARDADVCVHEATTVYIDASVDKTLATKGETPESCRARMISRGHSTPAMAGEFAKAINASGLVINHLSTRLLPDNEPVIDVVRQEASRAWGSGRDAIIAEDFLLVKVPKAGSGAFCAFEKRGA